MLHVKVFRIKDEIEVEEETFPSPNKAYSHVVKSMVNPDIKRIVIIKK